MARSVIDCADIPVLPSPSIKAPTCIPTLLVVLAPAPLSATLVPPVDTPTAPANTNASIVCVAVALADNAPFAVTLESLTNAATAPLPVPPTIFSASDAPIAIATPLLPTPTEAETAATVASILAVFRATSPTSPRPVTVLSSMEALVAPEIVLVALAPPPLRATLVLAPAAIDTEAEMQ